MLCLLSVVPHSKPLVNTSPHCDILLCRSSLSKERQPAQFFLSEWHPYTHFFPNHDEKKTAEMFSPLLSVVVGNLCGTQEALSVLLVKSIKSSLSKGGESYYCVRFTDIRAMYYKSIVCMCVDAYRGQKMVLGFLDRMLLQMTVSSPTWGLDTELGFCE